MAHLLTILLFLAMGGIAVGIMLAMLADYADRIALVLGGATQWRVRPSVPNRARRAPATRPAPTRRAAPMRVAA